MSGVLKLQVDRLDAYYQWQLFGARTGEADPFLHFFSAKAIDDRWTRMAIIGRSLKPGDFRFQTVIGILIFKMRCIGRKTWNTITDTMSSRFFSPR
jgi:hypothetical protein